MVRESRKYLIFFKSNSLIFSLFVVFFGAAGFYYQMQKPPVFTVVRSVELNYSQDRVQDFIALADEAVASARTAGLQRDLQVSSQTKAVIYKISPLAINIETSSINEAQVKEDNQKIFSYLNSRFPVKSLGREVATLRLPNIWAGLFFGVSAGFLLGLIISLIKTYLEEY